MKEIKEKNFPNERDLYASKNLHLFSCTFKGKEDGESALKESENIIIDDCYFDLRYPLWHDKHIAINRSTFTENSRAALWYSRDIKIVSSTLNGIKALRECHNVLLRDLTINSPEFGWKSLQIKGKNIKLVSEYAFLESQDIHLDNLEFSGKYSFQYTKNVVIENSKLDTKDCFWHAQNVTIKNSIVKGEYLAWYSKNLTFINCKITGTQPFCYCKNLKLINCTMEGCDLAFEYSDVKADITSSIESIKNPYKGKIKVRKVNHLIITNDSKYPNKAKIIETN